MFNPLDSSNAIILELLFNSTYDPNPSELIYESFINNEGLSEALKANS